MLRCIVSMLLRKPQHRRFVHMKVVLDLGRRPEARFLGVMGGEYLRDEEVRGSCKPSLRRLDTCICPSQCGDDCEESLSGMNTVVQL